MILSGADLVTNTIDGNIGGQLVIESLQDTVTGSNSGFGAILFSILIRYFEKSAQKCYYIRNNGMHKSNDFLK